MPDFSDPVTLVEGAAIAAVAWAYFFLLCPKMARRAGIEYKEPPVALYAPNFKIILIVTGLIALALGVFFKPSDDILSVAVREIFDLLATFADAAFLALLLALFLAIALRLMERFGGEEDEDEVEEPKRGVLGEEVALDNASLTGELAKYIGLIVVLAGVVLLVPILISNFVPLPFVENFMGKAPGVTSSFNANVSTALGLYFTFVFLWVIPEILAREIDEDDIPSVWLRASGLALWRWGWMGLIVLVHLGIHEPIPFVGMLFAKPLQPIDAGILTVLGPFVFLVYWVWPMYALAQQAKTDSRISADVLSRVRFGGLSSLISVKIKNKGTSAQPLRPMAERQVCDACLRSLDEIEDYQDFDFDHCPHCRSKIKPVFSLMDYVKNQAMRLDPMFEGQAVASGPLKERRVVQDIVRALLAVAVRDRGTDLHIAPEQEKLAIRVRTDGVLYTLLEFDKSLARPLISAVKVMANLNITERRKPQDGAFSVDFQDRHVDVRVNTSPVVNGEMAALRLLYVQDVLGSIEKLGITPRYLPVMTASINSPQGLILATGPTGSGKSTTLYNSLDTIANGTRNIITLEDPIEYRIGGLTQMQVEPSKGFTFSTGLRSILRQDPDVIMVGEIRDGETAKMAVDAAATGHLVFSTLHANDAVGVVGRLVDLDIDPRRVSEVTQLFLAQRLIRLNCTKCKRIISITAAELAAKGFPAPEGSVYEGALGSGCKNCHDSGYRGRIGIYEFFKPDEELKLMIAEAAKHPLIRRRARELGMRTVLEDGLIKVFLGLTTLDELQRVAGS